MFACVCVCVSQDNIGDLDVDRQEELRGARRGGGGGRGEEQEECTALWL